MVTKGLRVAITMLAVPESLRIPMAMLSRVSPPSSASDWNIPRASSRAEILTKSLAVELGPDGVRINAILPGVVKGERMNKVIATRAAATGVSVEAMRQQYLDKISLRRMVSADDVAALALFLCSPAARNLSGQVISVDGNLEYLYL